MVLLGCFEMSRWSSTLRRINLDTFSRRLVVKYMLVARMPKSSSASSRSAAKCHQILPNITGGACTSTSVTPDTNHHVSLNKTGCVTIRVHAKPGSKRSSITGFSEDGVDVQLAAPARDGEANSELLRFLAEVLGLRKTALSLDKGSKSRSKLVLLNKDALCVETVLLRLQDSLLS